MKQDDQEMPLEMELDQALRQVKQLEKALYSGTIQYTSERKEIFLQMIPLVAKDLREMNLHTFENNVLPVVVFNWHSVVDTAWNLTDTILKKLQGEV